MDRIHVLGNGLVSSAATAHEKLTTYSSVVASPVGQFPPLGIRSARHALCRTVARRYVWISLLCRGTIGPVVHYGTGPVGSFRVWIGTGTGTGTGPLCAFVLLDCRIRAWVGLGFLGMEGGGQGIDLALQLGHAAVGLLLSLSRGRSCDACAVGFGAPLAWLVRPFLVAANLEAATGVAGARALQVVRRLGGPGGVVGAVLHVSHGGSFLARTDPRRKVRGGTVCRPRCAGEAFAGQGSRTRRARCRRGRLHRATRPRPGPAVTSAPGPGRFVGVRPAVRDDGEHWWAWAGSMVLRHCAGPARPCRIVAGQESAAAARRTAARASDRCCLP